MIAVPRILKIPILWLVSILGDVGYTREPSVVTHALKGIYKCGHRSNYKIMQYSICNYGKCIKDIDEIHRKWHNEKHLRTRKRNLNRKAGRV